MARQLLLAVDVDTVVAFLTVLAACALCVLTGTMVAVAWMMGIKTSSSLKSSLKSSLASLAVLSLLASSSDVTTRIVMGLNRAAAVVDVVVVGLVDVDGLTVGFGCRRRALRGPVDVGVVGPVEAMAMAAVCIGAMMDVIVAMNKRNRTEKRIKKKKVKNRSEQKRRT